MSTHRSEQETRERVVDHMRKSGFDKRAAEKLADSSVGRTVDRLGSASDERARKERMDRKGQ